MNKEKDESGKKNPKKASQKSKSFFTDERIRFLFGILITGFALYLLLACVAYLFWWKTDQSLPDSNVISGSDVVVKNWSGKSGHFLAKSIISYGFGFGAFFIPLIFGTYGLYLLNFPKIKPLKLITKFAFAAILISLILSYIFGQANAYLVSGPGGAQGYKITRWMNAFMGKIGTGVLMAFITFTYLVFALGIKPSSLKPKLPLLNGKKNSGLAGELPDEDNMPVDGEEDEIIDDVENEEREETGIKEKPFEKEKIEFVVRDTTKKPDLPVEGLELPPLIRKGSIIHDFDNVEPVVETKAAANAEAAVSGISITKPDAGESLEPHEVERIMENYDPRLDLSHYKFPPVSILKEHKSETAFDNTEVFENKENIIKTLGDHKISYKKYFGNSRTDCYTL